MREQAYAAARAVAPSVRLHFVHQLDEALKRGEGGLASLPDEPTIAQMIDAAFWASLRREEGYSPKISLAFMQPGESTHPLIFGPCGRASGHPSRRLA
jgi:hypothetical protein